MRSSEAQLRSQQAGVTQSQASLRQNEVNLAHTVIESPIDGLVISRNVDVGQTVAASMSAPTLFVLAADLTKMQVLASLDESDVGRIRPGQLVRFRVDAFPTEEFIGNVTQVRLQPTTVQNVVTYQTVIDVPNPGLKLKPGMTANVNIEIARRADVIRVPNTALRFRPTPEIFTALGTDSSAGRHPAVVAGAVLVRAPTHATRSQTPAVAAQQAPAGSSHGPRRRGRRGARHQPAQPREKLPPCADRRRKARASAPQMGRGDGAGGGRRGGRGNFAERMANMTPEERERIHGAYAGARLHSAGRGNDGRGARGRRQRPGSAQARSTAGPTAGGAYGRFERDDVRCVVRVRSHRPRRSGRSGSMSTASCSACGCASAISDGQQTELIQALDGELKEDTEVVTNVLTGAVRQARRLRAAPASLDLAVAARAGSRAGAVAARGGGRGQ